MLLLKIPSSGAGAKLSKSAKSTPFTIKVELLEPVNSRLEIPKPMDIILLEKDKVVVEYVRVG